MEFEVQIKGFRSDFPMYPVHYGLSRKELFRGLVVLIDPSIQMVDIIRQIDP